MKFIRSTTSLLTFAFLLLGAAAAGAQTGTASVSLEVSVGDTYDYEGITSTEMTMNIPYTDSTRTVVQEAALIQTMEVSEITDDEIRWDLSGMSTMSDPEGSGEARTVPVVMTLVTDRQGRMKQIGAGGEENGGAGAELMSMMMNNSNGASQGPGWFLPADLEGKKVGESWTVTSNDTATVAIMEGMNMDLVLSVTTVYTYRGTVDTLGTNSVRLDWRVEEMAMDGEFEMPGTGMSMRMMGKGSGTGSALYSLQDKLLLVQTADMEMDQNIDMGAIGSQEMTMRIYTEQWRQE